MLNYLASLSYLVAALVCLAAAWIGPKTGRSKGDMAVWLCAAAMFLLFVGMRLTGGEDMLRAALRSVATGEGFYNARALGQIAALIVLAGVGWLGWHKIRDDWRKKRGSRTAVFIRWALLGMAGFVVLYALRLISLHFVDRLLYAGPVRLNWVLDGALTVTVAAAALFYFQHCRKTKPGQWIVNTPSEGKRREG